MSGHVVHLKPVVIQSLSELERVRLREVAFHLLQQDYDLGCPITIPKDGQKRKKSLRRKFDSLSKEKHKDKEFLPQTFGLPLWQVIANDRANKQRLDGQQDEQKDSGDPVFSILQFAIRRPFRDLSSSNSSLSSSSEAPNENTSPSTPEVAPRTHRRGAMSVDSITDLDDNQSRLLEALQLSLPEEKSGKKGKQRDKRLSLNPIYRQVPRLLDSCCQHLEKYGLQTVGIFRVGSSKKRVRQLREEFDRGAHIHLDEDHSTHDVAGLLKEFLRDMPDPLLTRELYTAFVNTASLNQEEQLSALRSLIYLLPPCNCDTLQRLLCFLSTVAAHAPDTYDKDGQEVTGNKMTSLNLATIFGPNLLHKTKSSDREFSVQSSVRAEESTAIIGVVQKMISSYEALFMVPPDLQNKVLMSLMESDPDVVDHLLRRKASQWSSTELFRSDDGISLDESHSGDSNKASSGDVSPYENNSPMLAVHSPPQSPGDGPCYTPQRCPRAPYVRGFGKEPRTPPGGGVAPPPREVPDGQITMWGAWHTTLRLGHQDHRCQGFHGSSWECSSQSSGETVDGLPGNHNQIALGAAEHRLHHQGAPASGSSCSKERQSHLQPSWDMPPILQGDLSEEAPRQRGVCTSTPYRSSPINRNEGRPPPPYPGFSRATLRQASPSYKPPLGPQGQRPLAAVTQVDTLKPSSLEWQDWQRERWQIWQLLSSDNADTLPETLV